MSKSTTQLKKKISKNLSEIKSSCEEVVKKYPVLGKMNHKDYIYLVFSYDIYLKTKDLLILFKKLSEEKNSFDSSMMVLARVINEAFFYMSYLLSESEKIDYRLDALTCYNCESNISKFNAQFELAQKKKYLLKNIESMKENIKEWKLYIEEHKKHKNNHTDFIDEINIFYKVEEICKKYDKIKGIKTLKENKEDESLEYMYNFYYRFQSLSVHQSLNDKEKIFDLILEKKNKPDNSYIIWQINDVLERVLLLK
jgi:hypothetical protein